MKRLAPLPLLLLVAGLLTAQPQSPHLAPTVAEAIPGRLIVKLSDPTADPVAAGERVLAPLAERFGRLAVRSWLRPELVRSGGGLRRGVVDRRGLDRILVVEFAGTGDPALVASKVMALPGVAYAEPVFRRHLHVIPNDPYVARQWYLERIRAFDAWDIGRGDSTAIVAIVDTGIDWVHPDLVDAIWRNPGESGTDAKGADRRTNGADDDGNGFVDDWVGYDFAGRDGRSADNDPSPGHWHGTHVAGIAAASTDNGVGIAGLAHGVRLRALKIADDRRESPTLVNGYDAILYAARMGATVINASWGGGGRSRAEQEVVDAVTDAGTLVVAAAGNDGRLSASYPASYHGVLSVASVMNGDRRSGFSNYSSFVGISAPGSEIYSTLPLAQSQTGYGYADGTSMASPMVAAAAALVRARYPSLDPAQVSAVLRASADNIDEQNPDFQLMLGAGRLNVLRALATGPNALLAGVESVDVIDASGDGLLEPGESFELRVTVRNYLRPASGVRLRLASAGREIEITNGEDLLGGFETGETRTSTSLRLVAPAAAGFDELIALRVGLESDAVEIGSSRVEVTVNPNFATTTNDRVTATLTGNGRIGFNDFPSNTQGAGFRFGGSDNLLAEGGLIIGTSPARLADVVRSAEPGYQSQGLQTVRAYRVAIDDVEGAEIGTAQFDDAHLHPMQRNGLSIDLTTRAYRGAGRDNQLLLFYRITNTSQQPLEGLHAALYLDWDIGLGGASNQTRLDPENRLGYTYNVRSAGLPYTGAMLVGEQPMNFMAADNGGDPIADGFYQEEKWQAISSGIRRDESSVGDCSTIIGAGPITLGAGEDTTIVFSLMAGDDLAALRSAATEARAVLTRLGMPFGGPLVLPTTLELYEPIPNPFAGSTRIEFSLAAEGAVTLDVFTAIGERVATLAEGTYPRGVHAIEFVPESSADEQVYFVRLVVDGEALVRKLVRLRESQ